jgi:hypothetical protein
MAAAYGPQVAAVIGMLAPTEMSTMDATTS